VTFPRLSQLFILFSICARQPDFTRRQGTSSAVPHRHRTEGDLTPEASGVNAVFPRRYRRARIKTCPDVGPNLSPNSGYCPLFRMRCAPKCRSEIKRPLR
jgi:hypothetical protein